MWGSLRDRALTDIVRDVLLADRRLDDIGLSVSVRGGVAHVEGETRFEEERQLVRQVIGRIRGIHAVWDLLAIRGGDPLRALDLGCGHTKQCSLAFGVDCHRSPAVNIIANLECALPFADDTVDHIFAVHVLEHVRDLLPLMRDVHRVLKPSGVLHVLVPNWHYVNALADPTHVRFFHVQTFKFFCRPQPTLRPFSPLSVSSTVSDIFVDLQPVKGREESVPDDVLSLFFD